MLPTTKGTSVVQRRYISAREIARLLCKIGEKRMINTVSNAPSPLGAGITPASIVTRAVKIRDLKNVSSVLPYNTKGIVYQHVYFMTSSKNTVNLPFPFCLSRVFLPMVPTLWHILHTFCIDFLPSPTTAYPWI